MFDAYLCAELPHSIGWKNQSTVRFYTTQRPADREDTCHRFRKNLYLKKSVGKMNPLRRLCRLIE